MPETNTTTTLPPFQPIPEEGEPAFIGWVTEHEPDAVIGIACIALDCPLSRWWSGVTGYQVAVGGAYHYIPDEGGNPLAHRNPRWTDLVMRVVDDFDKSGRLVPVTASMFLKRYHAIQHKQEQGEK